jgi:hypothetical protein
MLIPGIAAACAAICAAAAAAYIVEIKCDIDKHRDFIKLIWADIEYLS